MHVNKTKFERNGSQEYHHMTYIGKTEHMQTKEVYYPWRIQILMRYCHWSLHVIIGRSVH